MALHKIDPDDLPYEPSKLPRKKDISINDFYAVDLRVGYVVEVELLLDSREPAYRIDVDFGPVIGTLRSVAQLTRYPSDSLIGRAVVGVLNVGGRRISGIDCQFVALGLLAPDGTPFLVDPDGNPPAGAPFA